MTEDKLFLTYNQQVRKLRNDKNILCNGSTHKKILVRASYFNIVNGYKKPFVSGQDKGRFGRILEKYFRMLGRGYVRDLD